LGLVVQGLAVVGDQVQVDGQRLPAAAQGRGQVPLQGPVDAALQFGQRGQRGQQGVVGRRVGGGRAEGGTGGGEGRNPTSGVAEDSPEPAGGAFGPVVLKAEVLLAEGLGVGADSGGGDGIMVGAHGSLPGDSVSTSHSREGPCVWHPLTLPAAALPEPTEPESLAWNSLQERDSTMNIPGSRSTDRSLGESIGRALLLLL